jgi:hypothetical protein
MQRLDTMFQPHWPGTDPGSDRFFDQFGLLVEAGHYVPERPPSNTGQTGQEGR